MTVSPRQGQELRKHRVRKGADERSMKIYKHHTHAARQSNTLDLEGIKLKGPWNIQVTNFCAAGESLAKLRSCDSGNPE